MTKKSSKQILFERMSSVGGMPLNENYPWGAKEDPAAPWNEPELPDEENQGPDPDERHDIDHGEINDEVNPAELPKRWNNVSVWINSATEEDMRNAGFEFDQKGNTDLMYNGKKVGYLSNFNGVMLDDDYVDELIPMFQNFRGTGIWNYDGWQKEADERRSFHSGRETQNTNQAQDMPEDDAFLESVRQTISEFETQINDDFNQPVDEFIPHGSYTVSNSGGYEIMLDDSGDAAKVRDAFGSDNPKTSDWLEIEYVPDEDTGEHEPVIDPNGYNIPLNQVMRINGGMNENQ